MARKMTEWLSKNGPITTIMKSDGYKWGTVTMVVGLRYNLYAFDVIWKMSSF